MSEELILLLAADAILLLHVLFVVFVVVGLALIYIGSWRSWAWVRNFWFRVLHLIGVGFVVLEVWVGMACPLTVWEMNLRSIAGDTTYSGAFIQYWLQTILYYEAPQWLFIVCYTLFGGLVLASWFIVPPNLHTRNKSLKK